MIIKHLRCVPTGSLNRDETRHANARLLYASAHTRDVA